MKTKNYNTLLDEDVYQQYRNAHTQDNHEEEEEVILRYIQEEQTNNVASREDFFSLLLSEAIQQNDIELVRDILETKVNKDEYPMVLASIDEINMSPLAYVLLLDKEEGTIKAYLKEALNHGYRFHKVELTRDALLKMLNIVGHQGEDYQECIDDFIKPIVIEEEVVALGEAMETGILTYED